MNTPFAIVIALHWAAVVLYVTAAVTNSAGIVFDKKKAESTSYFIVIAGLAFHTMGLAYWWQLAGHGPYMGRFEVLSSYAWVFLSLFLLVRRIYPKTGFTSIVVFPSVFLTVALAIFMSPDIKKLPPTLRSIWLVLHVTFYKIALGTLLVALALSVFYILKRRTTMKWLDRIPERETVDLLAFRFAGFGFIFWAIAMLAGSIWAYQSWGRFWGWDPVETWALLTWGMFGVYLHLRRFFGWTGERAAYLFIVCFALSIFSVFFAPLWESSIHAEYFR
jgi:cytochrome c-type biogenesis protein CcsB